MPRKRLDLTGKQFGRLTVVSFGWTAENRTSYWNCVCSCGQETVVAKCSLTLGRTISCGCYQAEATKKANTTHGQIYSPEYHAWDAAKRRCHNPTDGNFPYYGARGIVMCDRWRNSFENFLADMGKKPDQSLTLDRIDNNCNYEPSNCRWTTMKVQSNNRRERGTALLRATGKWIE